MFSFAISAVLLAHLTVSNAHPTIHSRTVTNSSKAGLAWSNGNFIDVSQYATTGKVSWYYTWSPSSINTQSIEFVPMLWGQTSEANFSSTINQTISQLKPTAVLGMNEPQETGQSNLSPQQGAEMWTTYLEPLRSQGLRLGSPAPSSAPSGKQWLQDFLTTCSGCTVDFIALHWYGVNATEFIAYLEDFHNTFQRPLWVTEWACQNFVDTKKQCSSDDIVTFLNTTQSYMDSSDFVERYAWFGAMENLQGVNQEDALMDKNGKINDLGKQYIGAQSPKTSGSGPSSSALRSISSFPLAVLGLLAVLQVI